MLSQEKNIPLEYHGRSIGAADYVAAVSAENVHNIIGPHNVLLQVNYGCYLHCEMCDRHKWVKEGVPVDETMTTNQLLGLVDELSAMGTRRITIVGTEPVMRKDLTLMLGRIRENNIKPELYTAGIVLSDELIESILLTSTDVAFSLDGFNENSHNRIRVPNNEFNAYARTLGSIERLTKARAAKNISQENVRITANFTIQRNNISDLALVTPEQIDLCGLDVLRMSVVHGEGSYALVSEDIPIILEFMQRMKANSSRTEISFSNALEYLANNSLTPQDFNVNTLIPSRIADGTNKLKCHIAEYSTMIDPKGDVRPCLYLYDDNGSFDSSDRDQFVMGNVKNDSFRAIWNGEAYTTFRRSKEYPDLKSGSRCRTCEYTDQFEEMDQIIALSKINDIQIGW